MSDLGDIRRAASGAARTMREFERAVKAVRQRAIRGVQREGRKVHREMGQRYEQEIYSGADRRLHRVKAHSQKHALRKRKLRLDPRRGVMRKGVLKTTKSPLSYVRQPAGFDIDYTRPNLTVTGRATIGKSLRTTAGKRVVKDRAVVAIALVRKLTNRRSFLVNAYIGHFARQKALGLGSIAQKDLDRCTQAGADEVVAHVATIKGAARANFGARAAAQIVVRLDKAVGA